MAQASGSSPVLLCTFLDGAGVPVMVVGAPSTAHPFSKVGRTRNDVRRVPAHHGEEPHCVPDADGEADTLRRVELTFDISSTNGVLEGESLVPALNPTPG